MGHLGAPSSSSSSSNTEVVPHSVQYEVTCPDCGTTAVFEEDELLDGAPKCPNCGKPLDFEVTEE